METRWILFLDDMRHPTDVVPGEIFSRYHSDGMVFIWAKNIEQAKWYVEDLGLPELIWFDHDLGGDETSMQFLAWLNQEGYCNRYQAPGFMIHTSNPAGRLNILSFMNSWVRLHTYQDED